MHKIPLAAAAKKIKQIKAGLLHPLNPSTPGRPIKNPTLNTPRVPLPRMLCTVARAALPREYAEVFPLPPSVRTKPLHQEFFLYSPPCTLAKSSCRLHLLHTPHQRGRWPWLCHPSLCSHPELGLELEVSDLAGSRAGSLLCSAWLTGEKSSLGLEPFYRNPAGCSPPGDRSLRSTWEMRPRSGTGVGLAVNIIFHSSGTFWGRITFNELMLTHKVPDTPAHRQSLHPSLIKDSVMCDSSSPRWHHCQLDLLKPVPRRGLHFLENSFSLCTQTPVLIQMGTTGHGEVVMSLTPDVFIMFCMRVADSWLLSCFH